MIQQFRHTTVAASSVSCSTLPQPRHSNFIAGSFLGFHRPDGHLDRPVSGRFLVARLRAVPSQTHAHELAEQPARRERDHTSPCWPLHTTSLLYGWNWVIVHASASLSSRLRSIRG